MAGEPPRCASSAALSSLRRGRARARVVLGDEAALTYVSRWNANEAVIPILTDERTAIFSDALNDASIVDAIRLCAPAAQGHLPARRHDGVARRAAWMRTGMRKLIVTDGVFSMEGDLGRRCRTSSIWRAHTTRPSSSTTRTASVFSAAQGAASSSTSACSARST